jgi:Flp pilus assembly protein TadG
MRGSLQRLARDANGAVAPTVALSLFALIAAGGIAFDYARMATMDTELQDAADQAALAAASQLDGEPGACERAVAAARNMLANRTLMANETGSTRAITIADPGVCGGDTSITFNADASIRFYQEIDKDPAADDDSNAKFVEVQVDSRTAFFALTPVVAAFSSGQLTGIAFAGLGESVCNTPPVMMCNPSEPVGNIDEDFAFTANQGDGIRLVVGSASAPGNFGFLQTGYGTGAQDLARALGYNNPPADCTPANGVDTEPGDKEAVRAAFNTRFDLSEAGLTCPNGGTCSPSINSRKDLVRGNNCSTSGNQAWQEAAIPYRAPNTTPLSATNPMNATNTYPEIMGYPRDMCHAVSVDGECGGGGIIGDGAWDRDAYFRVNYQAGGVGWTHDQWIANTGLPADATRYQVYKWEMDHPDDVAAANANLQTMANGKKGYSTPVCRPPGVTPSGTVPDRRRIPIAVINCEAQGLNGRESGVQVLDWYDVFLVEPAFPRTGRSTNGDIYVEVIGKVTTTSNSTLQVVKKAVPYLIE